MRYYLTHRIELHLMPLAYLKIRELVASCDKECAWHGIVTANEERTNFTVHDIMVYPQIITSVTVEKDEAKYFEWHQNLPDEAYNNLKLQGHSHVNMAVSPSGVDRDTYHEIAETISADGFYIFMITNKRHEYYFEVLDKKNNVIYDKADIDLFVGDVQINTWVKDSLKLLAERKPITPSRIVQGPTSHWWQEPDKPAQTASSAFPFEQKLEKEIPLEAYCNDDIVSEDGDVVNTYLQQMFECHAPESETKKQKPKKKGAKKK